MGMSVAELKTEYSRNPLGIDVVHPRFCWIMQSEERSQYQAAYQIIVASTMKLIINHTGDMWESGKVDSSQSIHIVYAGKQLQSGQRYYWKVRVWDKSDQVSEWSESAMWSMGLLNDGEWLGKWIGLEQNSPNEYAALSLKDAAMIGLSEKKHDEQSLFYRFSFRLSADCPVQSAAMLLYSNRLVILNVNEQKFEWLLGYRDHLLLDITDALKVGKNLLCIEINKTDHFSGVAATLYITYENGESYFVQTGEDWKAASRVEDGWDELNFADSHWSYAHRIGTYRDLIKEDERVQPTIALNAAYKPSPYLRKQFPLQKKVLAAAVHVTALGLYELYINGHKVSADAFTPGWSDYNRRVYYQTYDVTSMMNSGENAIGVILGYGWYAGNVAMFGACRYGEKPYFLLQMKLEFEDGTTQIIVSDNSWKAATGPIDYSDILMGEAYDARKELAGWNESSFDDSSWAVPDVLQKYDGQLKARQDPPVRVTEELQPIAITRFDGETFVVDMGQNMIGWVKLKVNGAAGTKITLRFAEVLNPDGSIYTTNLRKAKQTDTYILKGNGVEFFTPRFTFHGFRYVEITGYPGELLLDAITGLVVHSATPLSGRFETSNAMINQLQRNITWGQRGNFLSVPTDCPQRDERMGWTADAQIFARTATFNMNVASFFTKWLVDVVDAQLPSGAFADVAPDPGWIEFLSGIDWRIVGYGSAAWGDAGVIIPWVIYQVYGDTKIIETNYKAMTQWIEYLQENSTHLLRPAEGFGDWLSIDADTPKDVLGTAYFAYSTKLLSNMAHVIGRNEDAHRYEQLFQQIKGAFQEAYMEADGRIKGDTQTCYVLALHMNLLPEEHRFTAAKYLADDIEQRGWHLSTGFVGVGYLLPVLTEYGYQDIAYRLLLQESFPSWGYSIRHGATTIWERWDGWTEEKGFQDPSMNSFNHYSLGSVGEWLFRSVAGIDLEPGYSGYQRILIRPQVGGNLTYAKGEFDSMYGMIGTRWNIKGGHFHLSVSIPVNTTATVYVPVHDHDAAAQVQIEDGVQYIGDEKGCAVYTIGSGTYEFSSILSPIFSSF